MATCSSVQFEMSRFIFLSLASLRDAMVVGGMRVGVVEEEEEEEEEEAFLSSSSSRVTKSGFFPAVDNFLLFNSTLSLATVDLE